MNPTSFPISRLFLVMTLSMTFALRAFAEESAPKSEPSSPFKNTPAVSEFHETEGRDPFSPIGYKKPLPKGALVVEKPEVDIKLNLTGVSVFGTEISATLSNGQIIEQGQTYKYTTPDGKTTVDYKVLNISEDGVTILYNDKQKKIELKGSDLNLFKEKDAP